MPQRWIDVESATVMHVLTSEPACITRTTHRVEPKGDDTHTPTVRKNLKSTERGGARTKKRRSAVHTSGCRSFFLMGSGCRSWKTEVLCFVLLATGGVGKRNRYPATARRLVIWRVRGAEVVKELITRFVQNHVRAIMLKRLQIQDYWFYGHQVRAGTLWLQVVGLCVMGGLYTAQSPVRTFLVVWFIIRVYSAALVVHWSCVGMCFLPVYCVRKCISQGYRSY